MEYDYILERMTAQEFQELIQALMEAEYGLACDPFPVLGSDGGRDIVIRNNQNPNGNDEIWIQAKYKSGNTQRDTTWICSQVKRELQKITSYAQEGKTHLPYAWICYTNISISGVVQTGAHDRLQTIFSDFRDKIPKLEVFGKEKVSVLLRNHPNVAKSFSSTIYPEIWNHSESKRVIAIWPSTLAQYCHSIEAEEELKKLINRKKQPIFITGFGGIGKSEFATHVIPDVWKNHAYRVVFEKDLLHTIASIEIDGLKRTDARGRPKSPEILFQECMEVLRVELSEKDILVIDNYDFLKLHDMTAMNQLLELGWLRCDEKNNVVSVHPLIALLCRHSHLTKPSVDHCRTFLNSFSKYLRRPPTICDNDFSMSLAQNILTHTKCDSDKIEYIEFQDNYGYFQFLSGNYVASENNILSAVEALWKKRQYAKAVPVCIDYAMVLEIQRKMELEADFLHDLEELPEFRAVYQKEPQLYFEVLVIWGTWLRVQSQQKQAIDRLERAEALLDSENIKIFRQQMVAQPRNFLELFV